MLLIIYRFLCDAVDLIMVTQEANYSLLTSISTLQTTPLHLRHRELSSPSAESASNNLLTQTE